MISSKLGAHDTCGVHNLHGMPAVLAGLSSAVFVVLYDPADYGNTLGKIYPAMATTENHQGISAGAPTINQLLGLGLVLVGSLVSGFVTGTLKIDSS